MADVAIQAPLLTEREYLEMELASPVKHEYVAGRIYAMTGTSDAHDIIALNLATILRKHLRGSHCRVFMGGVKLRVGSVGACYYPDLMVSCEKAAHPHYREQPVLVVEVVSESTATYDAGDKRRAYLELESLRE